MRFLNVHQCRFSRKNTTFGFLTMEGLCWQSYMHRRQFDTYGRWSYSSTVADVIITVGRDCRHWSCSVKLLGYNFIFCGGDFMQPMITFNVLKCWWVKFAWLLYRLCSFKTASGSFPTEESVTALYSRLDMMLWVLLCKWEVEQGGNMKLRMPS